MPNEKILRYKIAGGVDPSVTKTANDVISAYSKIEGITVKQKRAVDALAKSTSASAVATVKNAQADLSNARASEVRSRTAERTAKSVGKITTEINKQIAADNKAARQSEATSRQVARDYDNRAKAISKSYEDAIRAQRRAESAQSRPRLRASISAGIKDAAISSLPIAGAAAAGQFAIGELEKATKLASDLNETIQKSEQVFGRSEAAGIANWANGAAKSLGLAKGEAIDAAASFGNLLRTANITGTESADLSKQLVALAGDMASFGNFDPSEVLQNLQSGLNGEMEPLRKFGVFLSEARVKAEAFADGIAKPVKNAAAISQAHRAVEIAVARLTSATKKYGEGSVEAASAQLTLDRANGNLEKALQGSGKELTQQEKLLARVKLLFKDTAIQQGDFARTATGAANSERVLNAELQNLETRLGAKLLPARIAFIGFLSSWVETGDKAANVTDRLGQKLERIINLPKGRLSEILQAVGWAAFGGPQRAVIDLLDKQGRQNSNTAALNASPGGQMSAAASAAKLIANAKRTGRSTPELMKALEGLGVDTQFRGYSGEFQAMLDHGTVEARNRMAEQAPAVRSDMVSRLMGAYTPARPLPTKTPPGMAGAGTDNPSGTGLYSGADRKSEESAAEHARKKREAELKKAQEKAKKDAETTMDDIRAATHETLEGYVDYLQNALKAGLNTFENKLPEDKLTEYRKGLGGLLDQIADAQRAVAKATYRDEVARDPKNTQAAQARYSRTLKGITQDRRDASGQVDRAQQEAEKRIADGKKEQADKLQDRLEFEAKQFEDSKKEQEERVTRLREFAENEIKLLEGVRDNVSDLDTQQEFTRKILDRASALASSDFFAGLLSGDTDRMMRGLLRGQQARADYEKSRFEIAKKMAEAHDTYVPPDPDAKKTRSSILGKRTDAAFSEAGDMAWREFDTAGERLASGFLESLVNGRGRGRRNGMGELLKDVARDAGTSLAQQAGHNLMREIERPLADVGKSIGKYIMDGGNGAAKAIGQAALYLQSISLLSGAQGKKKQKAGFLGSLLGLAVGSIIPGGNLLTDAAIGATVGGSFLGGMFANGGTAPGRRISLFGENGPELGIPKSDMQIFTAEQTANLYAAANGTRSARGGNVNHIYIDKVDNRAGVDQVRQIMDDERQREAFV